MGSEDQLDVAELRLLEQQGNVIHTKRPMNAPHHVLYVSANSEPVLGIPAQKFEVSPEIWMQRIHPDDQRIFKQHINRAAEEGVSRQMYRIQHGDGSYITLHDELFKHNAGDRISPVIIGRSIPVFEPLNADDDSSKGIRNYPGAKSSDSSPFSLSGSSDNMLQHEITKQEETNEKLKRSLRYQQAITECSRILLSGGDEERAVEKAMNALLEATKISRVYIFKNHKDASGIERTSQLYEVTNKEVISTSHFSKLQNLPYTDFPWWREQVDKNKVINTRITDLPAAERQLLEPMGIKSVMALALQKQSEVFGFIGFDDVKEEHGWNEDDINLLKTSAKMFGAYFERNEIMEKYHETANRYQHLFNAAHDGIFIMRDHIIVDCNDRVVELLEGKSKDDIVGKRPEDFSPEYQPDGMPSDVSTTEKIEAALAGQLQRFSWVHKTLLDRNIKCKISLQRIELNEVPHLQAFLQDITDYEEVQENLKLKESAIAQLNDMVVITDARKYGKFGPPIQFVNKSFEEHTGYRKDEVIGREFSFLQGPDTNSESNNKIIEAVKRAEPFCIEMINYKKNGDKFWVEINSTPIFNERGELTHWIGINRDITERKKMVNQLSRQQRSLERAQKIAKLGNWDWNRETGDIYWSDQMYELFGLDKKDASVGLSTFFDHLPDEEFEKISKMYYSLIEHPESFTFTHKIRRADGKLLTVKETGEVKLDDEGEIVSVTGTIQDITEVYEAKREVNKLSNIASKTHNGMFITDLSAKITWVNKAFEEISGYREEEVMGRDPFEILSGPNTDLDIGREFRDARMKGENITREILNYRPDGEPYWVQVDISPITDNEGNITGTITVHSDITARKRVEDEIKASLEEKKVLLQEVHHRVKNNLAVISGLLELQSFEVDDQNTQNILKNSQMRIFSMAKIHEILYHSESLSQIQFDQYLEELALAVADTYSSQDAKINLDIKLEPVKLNVNQAVPCALLVNELTINAFKHAFGNMNLGRLILELSEQDNWIQLKVCDNGTGLPDNFDLDESASMGMTIIKTLVNQLEADFDYYRDNGTTFVVSFKRSEQKGSASML